MLCIFQNGRSGLQGSLPLNEAGPPQSARRLFVIFIQPGLAESGEEGRELRRSRQFVDASPQLLDVSCAAALRFQPATRVQHRMQVGE